MAKFGICGDVRVKKVNGRSASALTLASGQQDAWLATSPAAATVAQLVTCIGSACEHPGGLNLSSCSGLMCFQIKHGDPVLALKIKGHVLSAAACSDSEGTVASCSLWVEGDAAEGSGCNEMELGPFPFTVFHGTDGKHLPFLMQGACMRGVYIDELAGRIVGPVHAMDCAKQERCFFLVPRAGSMKVVLLCTSAASATASASSAATTSAAAASVQQRCSVACTAAAAHTTGPELQQQPAGEDVPLIPLAPAEFDIDDL